MPLDRDRYLSVLRSPRWHQLRTRLLAERGRRCEACKKTKGAGVPFSLELHHLTYERLGAERDTDVQLLCDICHAKADVVRAEHGRQRARSALYRARLDGWARKKYGDDWADYRDEDVVAEMFDRWLESRQ